MARLERIREAVKGPLDTDYIRRREQEGWRLVGVEWEVEWERESETATSTPPQTTSSIEEAPRSERALPETASASKKTPPRRNFCFR